MSTEPVHDDEGVKNAEMHDAAPESNLENEQDEVSMVVSCETKRR